MVIKWIQKKPELKMEPDKIELMAEIVTNNTLGYVAPEIVVKKMDGTSLKIGCLLHIGKLQKYGIRPELAKSFGIQVDDEGHIITV